MLTFDVRIDHMSNTMSEDLIASMEQRERKKHFSCRLRLCLRLRFYDRDMEDEEEIVSFDISTRMLDDLGMIDFR